VLRQLAGLYRDGTLIGKAVAEAAAKARRQRPMLEQRLASIGAEIARAEQSLEHYFDAFEQGKLSPERCDERLSRLQARLSDLRGQQAELAASAPDEGTHAPTAAELAAIANQLEHLVANAEPQQVKALLRHLIAELKVNGRAEIQPTYRVITPTVCATSEKVERTGIEPVTSGLQSSTRPCGLSRDVRGLPPRAGAFSVAFRGLPGAAGAFRRPRAGCTRDGRVVSLRNAPGPARRA
jgi:exonuclease VII small subunit